ncbi:MAG: family 78 glycoside hydrolase catalytic domain [Planctomycetota bacterium]|nr:family 78 glycoside hydrolase catalytic domain [Planctomycetota bacterium]
MRTHLTLPTLCLSLVTLLCPGPTNRAQEQPEAAAPGPGLLPTYLRCEYLANPLGIDETSPRLSWLVVSSERGQRQTAYRILVASREELLGQDRGDLWDTDKVASDQTAAVVYDGRPLESRQNCFWKVKVWDRSGQESPWSRPTFWSMGLLQPEDWQAQWISFRDTSPVHNDRQQLCLPPTRHYRKEFRAAKPIARATVSASALGIYELHLNGQRVGQDFFTPGWSDYHRRVYYNTYDVTKLMRQGANTVGGIVADGWYAGYVGYGLLVGYGPNKAGRNFYGKTPAILAQLEIEYTDGSREMLGTDPSWQVSSDGPFREADLIMGETFDARLERADWCTPGGAADWQWQAAIRAEDNGRTKATFYDTRGAREVELGFQLPPRLQAYSAPPIRVTELLPAQRLTEPQPGTYIFDLGQNFAGIVRLQLRGPAGTRVQIRYGEMLHPDGRLMTENLRRARATDTYILRGASDGESWEPHFTYHGFQFVELTGLPAKPALDAVRGVVIHNVTPLIGSWACSDDVLTRFWKNTQWTQRANFVELPTDCPQRDERLGWMGDAQVYIRAASYNADVAAFFTKWLDDLEEAQRDFGAYPDYCPYPMAHGAPQKTFGTAWTDAGIICPWTVWKVYGDTRVIERHWASMRRFMDWRRKSAPDLRGVSIGNTWGDWLNVGEATPIEYIDACYHALDAKLMADMADAIGRSADAEAYRKLFADIRAVVQQDYVRPGGTLTVDTQTAYVLALWIGLLPDDLQASAAARLAEKIAKNEYRMATGFLGTKPLLPVLTANGHHDLAVRLYQSRKFPSWGYEVINGATSVWERWDSYTKADGFGRHNAGMNSFSHYSFGAVTEWMFRDLAGIDTDGPGFQRLLIRPGPPTSGSNPDQQPVDWVQAEYTGLHGRIVSHWKRDGARFDLHVVIPANTTATVLLPTKAADGIQEGGRPLGEVSGVKFLRMEGARAVLAAESGTFDFLSDLGVR